jgi:RES domain
VSPVGPCGNKNCPVPEPTAKRLARLRTVTIPAGTPLRRGVKATHPDPSELVPGVGSTRFAPLDGVRHAYVARTTFATLLESALHEASPPAPRIYEAQLAMWMERTVLLARDVRLVDLRDAELNRAGIDRAELVATTADHYPCTRTWAQALHGRSIGARMTHGLLWHSRQRELHALALRGRPALRELIDEHPAEVGVLWAPPASTDVLITGPGGLGTLDAGAGRDYIDDLVALLGIVCQ